MYCLKSEDKQFERNTLLDGEPMKTLQDGHNMIIFSGVCDQACCAVLNALQFGKAIISNANKQRVAVVKP